MKKYENSSQGQRSRSNVTNFQPFPVFPMAHIPTKLHRFSTSSFRDFVRTDTQTHRRRQKQYLLAACAQANILIIMWSVYVTRLLQKERRTAYDEKKSHTKMTLSLMKISRAATLLNKVLTDTKYNSPYLSQISHISYCMNKPADVGILQYYNLPCNLLLE